MAYSKRDWEKLVRKIAANTENVTFTKHVLAQMKARQITMAMALDILRKGTINREPEIDIKMGHTNCLMQRFTTGKMYGVIIALEDDAAIEGVVVTAFKIGD